MFPQRFLLAIFLGVSLSAPAQFSITGVADRANYNESVTFTVTPEAGFSSGALLNGRPATVGSAVVVNQPDYYELRVTATNTTTSAVASNLVRFLVNASERNGSEWGLPRQVPWPVIQSSPAEFAGGVLRVMAPDNFPTGYEIPIVARVEDAAGLSQRVLGVVAADGQNSIQLKRGVGSGFLGSNQPPGALNYAPTVGGLTASKTITLEAGTAWTSVSGVLGASTDWPENARIFVAGGITVPTGGTLTIGAGAIVRVGPGLDLTNNGTITFNGTVERPIVFMPNSRAQPWGGFVSKVTGAGTFTGAGVIFTGSGANPSWFGANGNPGSHRVEQALFYLDGGQTVNLTDAAAIYLSGQLGHTRQAGAPTAITLTRFLMQRTTTGGEFTGARFTANDSAFIECMPNSADPLNAFFTFTDGDNDGLYLVDGTHSFTNTIWGWTKDDGVDSGGDGVGRLHYEGCWFEAIYHEGNSLSGLKNTSAHRTTYLDCGQGLEDGYGAGGGGPTGRVDTCLFLACQSGVRHGDNYPSIGNGYPGILAATNCILLHNHRDVFGFNWRTGGFTNATGQMFIRNNFVTEPNPYFPDNFTWDGAGDGHRLAEFGGKGRVGVGLAVRAGQTTLASFPNGIPVGLSLFSTNEVRVDYVIAGTDGTSAGGTLVFPAGKMRDFIPVPGSFSGVLRVALVNPVNADVTGAGQLLFQNLAAPGVAVLSPLGATWRYLDNGTDQGTNWISPAFNDAGWSNGVARLGFGPDAAAVTTLRRFYNGTSGAQITNYYFRRALVVTNPAEFATIQFRYQRDDGCVVYLNGEEAFRNNMPAGAINWLTVSSTTISGAAAAQQFWTNTLPASRLLPGTNILAVEVHQASATSSDIAWEMELRGLPAASSATVSIARLGGEPVVYWSDGAFTLEQAENITGPWTLAVPPISPAATGTNAAQKFFRLRR